MKLLKVFRVFLAVIIAGLSFVSAQDKQISLSAQLTDSDIKFEETTDLQVTVIWRGDRAKYMFEPFPLPQTQNLMVQGTSTAVTSGTDSLGSYFSRTYTYTFKPITGGIGLIDPITLRYVEVPDSLPGELTTQQFQVAISEPQVVKHSNNQWYSYLLYIFGGFGILVIGFGAVWYFKLRKKTQVEPILTAEELFLNEFNQGKKEGGSDRKIFFTRLHRALTKYIEVKYDFSTTGKTSVHITEYLENRQMDMEHREKLIKWLSTAEKEKYAPLAGEPGDTIRLATEIENHFRNLNKSS